MVCDPLRGYLTVNGASREGLPFATFPLPVHQFINPCPWLGIACIKLNCTKLQNCFSTAYFSQVTSDTLSSIC